MARMLVMDVNEVDVYEGEFNELQDYYDAIGCSCIDIVHRKVGERYFDIIVDDEGLLKDDFRISAVDANMRPQLAGTLIFCNHDKDGNETSLSDADIEHIRGYIKVAFMKNGDFHPILTECGC